MLQSFVSARRIENYLQSEEIIPVPQMFAAMAGENEGTSVLLNCATITWPRVGKISGSVPPTVAPTPVLRFAIRDISLRFPEGQMSLVCGKLGEFLGMLATNRVEQMGLHDFVP